MKEDEDFDAVLSGTRNPLLKAKAIKMRANGMGIVEIANALGVGRHTISRWMNSRDVKQVVNSAQNRLKALIEPSVSVFAKVIQNVDKDPTNALRAAKDVLKTNGIIKDNIEMSHVFPKPTVIRRVDGTEVILGAQQQLEETPTDGTDD